jgi:hypothetical protein
MSAFITPETLRDLTGYRRPGAQIKWLRDHGWRFEVNAAGHPRVAQAYFDRKMVSREPTGKVVDFPAPDWTAARG